MPARLAQHASKKQGIVLTKPIRVGKSATKAGIKAISKDKESSEKLLKLKSNLKMLKKATESAVASKASKKALAKPKKKLLKEVQKKDTKARPVSQAQLAKRKKLNAAALKRIEREGKTGIYDEFHKLHVTVVDKHHHVLKPIWDAKKRGDLPSSGVKLLHFDSHPDMAVFGSNVDPDAKKDVAAALKITPQIYHDNFDQTEVMRLSDISDWVFTPVLQGMVDEVIWMSGWWCTQLDKNATHEMYVGIDREDGKMKVAIKDDRLKLSMMDYWSSGGFAVKLEKLDYVRPFKMHVVHFNKKCKLEPEWMAKIEDICKGQPWILDIDEDYLSTQNPFTVEFEAMFGESMWDDFIEVTEEIYDEECEEKVNKMAESDAFFKGEKAYMKDPLVEQCVETLTNNNKHMTRRRARHVIQKIRPLLSKLYPKHGPAPKMPDAETDSEDEDEDYLSVRAHYDVDEILQAAAIACLPHHISTIHELTALGKETRDLFVNIDTPPGVVTIATSRSDMYTPEYQADILNFMVIDICEEVWKGRRDTKTHRRDWRATPLSCAEDDAEPAPLMLAMMLSNGKLTSLPKVASK